MGKEDKIDILLAYLKGRLKKKEAMAVEKEMKRDPAMRDLYALLCELGAESGNLDWSEIDATVRAMSNRMVNDFFKEREGGVSAPGVLIYDSKMLPLPAGVRPASVDVRRLKFRIDEKELMISLYPVAPNAYEVMGQLSGYTGNEPIEISLRAGKKTFQAESDEFQLFHFARIPSGDYRLIVTASGETIADLDIDV